MEVPREPATPQRVYQLWLVGQETVVGIPDNGKLYILAFYYYTFL